MERVNSRWKSGQVIENVNINWEFKGMNNEFEIDKIKGKPQTKTGWFAETGNAKYK